MLHSGIRNRVCQVVSIAYRVHNAFLRSENVKKVLAILAVTLVAGCSSMGSGFSGGSGTSSNATSSGSALQYQRQMFDPSGQLSIYHGG